MPDDANSNGNGGAGRCDGNCACGGVAKRRRGNPKWDLPDLAEVENLAARGLTMGQIASFYGISTRTIFKRKNQSREFAAAIKRGAAKGVMAVSNRLFESATKGNNTVAQIFFLKCRGGPAWREYNVVELSAIDGAPIELDGDRDYAESYEKRRARARADIRAQGIRWTARA